MVTITKLKCDKKFMIYYFGLVFPRKKLYAYGLAHKERKRRGKAYLRCTQPTSLLII